MSGGYSSSARVWLGLLMAAALFLLGAGCGPRGDAKAPPAPVTAEPGVKRYPLTGEVVRADLERKVLLVTHDEIPGYMPAMTMEFQAARGDLENARPGQRIRAEMVVRGDDFALEKIWPDDPQSQRVIAASTNALAQDTSMRGRGVYREVGETLPDFTLFDQEGRAVSINRFRGKHVVLNFIFTRCPVATMCPAATLKMMALQQAARAAGVGDLELVSLSLDPEYDTPGVLKEYAEARGIDTANFTFLTGPDAAVRHLLAQLGILREFEGATIKHTLATVLVDPQGRIVHRADGTVWDTKEFLDKIPRR